MTFDIFRTLSLSYLGEEWKDCYLKFSYLTADEAKDFASLKIDKDDPSEVIKVLDKAIEVIKNKFVEGKAIRDGKIVELSKEDVNDLPVEILNKCVQLLVGSMEEGEKKDTGGQSIPEPSGS